MNKGESEASACIVNRERTARPGAPGPPSSPLSSPHLSLLLSKVVAQPRHRNLLPVTPDAKLAWVADVEPVDVLLPVPRAKHGHVLSILLHSFHQIRHPISTRCAGCRGGSRVTSGVKRLGMTPPGSTDGDRLVKLVLHHLEVNEPRRAATLPREAARYLQRKQRTQCEQRPKHATRYNTVRTRGGGMRPALK